MLFSGTRFARWSARAWVAALIAVATAASAWAHSETVGFVTAGPGSITVYYGTYHGVVAPEGIVSLVGPVTISKAAGNVVGSKPAGLIDGTNNFYAAACNGGSLSTINAWQSATFTGVPDGVYAIQLTGSFSNNWQPCDTSISSGTSQFVVDTTAPTIANVPANITVFTPANSNKATATWTAPTAADASGVASFTPNYTPGSAFPLGATTVTYTATDKYGNTSTASFTVTVVDNVPPVITGMPANITLTPASGSSSATASWIQPTAADNVGVTSLTSNFASGGSFPLGVTTVTYKALDAAGNQSTASFTVTVADTTPPVLSACPANQTRQATGPAGAAATWTPPTATDNSGSASVTSTQTPGATFPLGTTTVVYTAIDSSSNSSTCAFQITVQDTTPPAFSAVPANVVLEATSAAGAKYTYTMPVAADIVSGSRPVSASAASGSMFPFSAPGPTTTTVTFTAADTASPANTASANFTVTVRDTTPPVISGLPANLVVEATGPSGAIVNYGPVSASDTVDPAPTVTYSQASGSQFPIGTTTVTVTARDASNNRSAATFTVTVRDSTPPVIAGLPANMTVQATGPGGAVVAYPMPTATDLVTAPVAITTAPASGTLFPVGTTNVSVTARDAAGNVATQSFQINVIDSAAPVFANVPADIVVEATSPAGAAVTYTMPVATDAVDGARPVSASHASGATFPLGVTIVTLTATDLATPPNPATATFKVTVRDTTPPVIGSINNITVTAASPSGATTAIPLPAASDLADPAPAVTLSPASGTLFPIGVNTVTVTATDASGNTSSRTLTVTVLAPAQMTVAASGGLTSTGPQGELGAPFVPNAQYYTVTNTGQAPMDFTVAGMPLWVSVSPVSGTLVPGASTTVAVALNATADTLGAGTYNASLAFNNASGGLGSTTRPVTLTITAPAALTVTPGSDFLASGPQGGPFAPAATTYILQNNGNSALNFAVSNDNAAWMTLVPALGTVPAGASIAVVATLTAGAKSLPAGVAKGTLTFTNTTNGVGSTTRAAALTVLQPAALVVTANDGLVARGNEGGPFAPGSKNYTLTNKGAVPLSYSASTDSSWIAVSSATGIIPAFGSIIVPVTVGATANTMPNGAYNGTVSFQNTTNGAGSATRPAALTIIPFGGLSLKIVTSGGDGTANFTSPVPSLSMSLTTSGGTAQSAPVSLPPGTYTVTASLPEGSGLSSVTCAGGASSALVSHTTATITLAASGATVCTFAVSFTRAATATAMQNFMRRRNDMLLSNGPDAGRQIDRLLEVAGHSPNAPTQGAAGQERPAAARGGVPAESPADIAPPIPGRTGGGTGGSLQASIAAALQANAGRPSTATALEGTPNAAAGSSTADDHGPVRLAFATSLSALKRQAAEGEQRKFDDARGDAGVGASGLLKSPVTRPGYSPFDLWFQGHYTRFNDNQNGSQTSGHAAVLHFGADYIFNPNVLVGIGAQYDSMRMASAASGTDVGGKGWMAGPYTTIRLSENMFLQARAAAGQSNNSISPFQTYTDTFTTSRWLASATLAGRWQYGAWQFRPSATIAYIEDISKAYIDSLGVSISPVKSTLGQAKAGPEVSHKFRLSDGTTIEPRVGVQAIWNFAGGGTGVDFGGTLQGTRDVRGRIETGVKLQAPGGATIDAGLNYDGLGSKSFQAIGGKATIRIPLN